MRSPAVMPGATIRVATWPPPSPCEPALELPSSKVMNSTPLANAGLSVIRGTKSRRKASPWATDPSCMSLIRLGVMNAKAAAAGKKFCSGWMLAHWTGSPDT